MAQAPGGTRRLAFLGGSNAVTASARLKALADGLSELGWEQGRNLRLDLRYAEGNTLRYRPLAVELLAQKPDVLDIPVEQVNVYEPVVNLKTARALGIKLPPSFLLQATQAIE